LAADESPQSCRRKSILGARAANPWISFMEPPSSPSTAFVRMMIKSTLSPYYCWRVVLRFFCSSLSSQRFGPPIQGHYGGYATNKSRASAILGMPRCNIFIKVMFESSPSQTRLRWVERPVNQPLLPFIISASYPAAIRPSIPSNRSAHRCCAWTLRNCPSSIALRYLTSKGTEAMDQEITAEFLCPLVGRAQLLEAIILVAVLKTVIFCLPGRNASLCTGSFPLTHNSRFVVEGWDVVRQEVNRRGIPIVPYRGFMRALDCAPERNAPALIGGFYAMLTCQRLSVPNKCRGKSALMTAFRKLARDGKVPDLIAVDDDWATMRRLLDKSAWKGKTACSAHSVEPAPKSTRSVVPIVTAAARTPIAVMILRLAKTSCRCANRVYAPRPAPFAAGYWLFLRLLASRGEQSPSPASTRLPTPGRVRRIVLCASVGCRMSRSLQLEPNRGGRAWLSGLHDEMTDETGRTHAYLDFLSREFVWRYAQQPCLCVAVGGRASRVFVKFPTGRKFSAGRSFFFLPVGILIRILLTIYQ